MICSQALQLAGDVARKYGHRITSHPSEFCKIAGLDRPDWTSQSIRELEVHSKIFDYMGFLPAAVYNKINIHMGGVYGDKVASMDRFAQVVQVREAVDDHANIQTVSYDLL